MGRNRVSVRKVTPHVDKKVKGGGVVLGRKMLRQKKQTDVQKQDPRLLEETQVKLIRDSRLERWATQAAYTRGGSQRKKRPVLKSTARASTRSVTIYKTKTRVGMKPSGRSFLRRQPEADVKSIHLPQAGRKSVSPRKTRRSLSKKVSTPKKAPKAKVRVPLKKTLARRMRGSKKTQPKKSPIGRRRGQRKPGMKRASQMNRTHSPKKMKLQIPQHEVLINLIQEFEIRLTRNERIEELGTIFKLQKTKQTKRQKNINEEIPEVPTASTEGSSDEPPVEVEKDSITEESSLESVEVKDSESLMDESPTPLHTGRDEEEDDEDVSMAEVEEDTTGEKHESSVEEVAMEIVEVGDDVEVIEEQDVAEVNDDGSPETPEEDTSVLPNEDEVEGEEEEEEETEYVFTTLENSIINHDDDDGDEGDEEIGVNGVVASVSEEEETYEGGELDLEEDLFESSLEPVVEDIPINYGNQIRNALVASEAKKVGK